MTPHLTTLTYLLTAAVVYAAVGKCRCNVLGSLGATCDAETSQCRCKQGVGGLRCDRCEPSYWGLQLIANTPGNGGCIREFVRLFTHWGGVMTPKNLGGWVDSCP